MAYSIEKAKIQTDIDKINKQIFETTLKEFKSTILNRPEKARGDLGTRFAIILLL